MSKFKKILLIFLLFTIYIIFSLCSYSNAVSQDISSNIFRLHVIANSDSDEDQALKYIVRDAVINYMNNICSNINSKSETISIAKENLESIRKVAQDTIYQNGYNYNVNIEIGNFEFPTKSYGDISLPSGFYDALKIEIGMASGKNWWCVMFPSLCFINVTNGIVPDDSKEILQENLDLEAYNLISSENTDYKLKFKIVELFENTKIFVAKK